MHTNSPTVREQTKGRVGRTFRSTGPEVGPGVGGTDTEAVEEEPKGGQNRR